MMVSQAMIAFASILAFVTASLNSAASATQGANPKRRLQQQQMQMLQVATSDQVINVRGPDSPGVGDIYVWDRRNKLYGGGSAATETKSFNESNIVGDNEGHYIRLTYSEENPGASRWDCNFVLYFDDGQLNVHGPFGDEETMCAITGRSGAYINTTGTMVLSFSDETYIGETGEEFPVFNYGLDIIYN